MKTSEQSEPGLTAELLSCFEAANIVNKQTAFRASMPYRIGVATTRAVNGLPVTLMKLHCYDGLIRAALISPDPEKSIRQLLERDSFFRAYHPEEQHLERCLGYCADGRTDYATLVAAHALAVRAHTAGEGKDYQNLLLDSWRIIKGKVIANQEDPGWHVDDKDCFRPRLRWNQGGVSSMYRRCPHHLQESARAEALRLLRSESG